MVSLLLEGEHKSFKAANDFFFPLLGEGNGFFFLLLSSVSLVWQDWSGRFFVRCRPLPVQLSRNLLPSLPWPLYTPVFLAVWFFWRVLCVRGDV